MVFYAVVTELPMIEVALGRVRCKQTLSETQLS